MTIPLIPLTRLLTPPIRPPPPPLPPPAINLISPPTPDVSFPTTDSTGPKAATSMAIFTIVFFVPSSRLLNLSTHSWIFDTISRIMGIRESPMDIASSASCDFRIVSCPARLSCMTADIFSATPLYPSTESEQVSIAFSSFSMSPGAAFISARNPLIACFPTSASAFDACSDSESFPNAVRHSFRMSFRLLIDPSAFDVCMTVSPSSFPTIFISPLSSVIILRRVVPACEDFIPAFAIRPIASAVSSAEYPIAPAIGATYLKVSPIMETFVFALLLAAARISAK